ncbi:hypothetical protein SUGI_1197170 [Cryptomeria japonica]|nr:hypothetical protein SUGI_1197170 [Cryptomeria japonica]
MEISVTQLVLLLPSIAAAVYTVAALYKGKQENSFAAVIMPFPTVWKHMLIPWLWYFIINFAITVTFAFIVWLALITPYWIAFYVAVAIVPMVLEGVRIYVEMVWQVTTVVSVMEEGCYGLESIKKSHRLIHGKRITAWALTGVYIENARFFNFVAFVGNSYFLGLGAKMLCGTAYVVLAYVIILMWAVTQSVFYFVCKSHHRKSVDDGLSLEDYPKKTNNNNGSLKLEP